MEDTQRPSPASIDLTAPDTLAPTELEALITMFGRATSPPRFGEFSPSNAEEDPDAEGEPEDSAR